MAQATSKLRRRVLLIGAPVAAVVISAVALLAHRSATAEIDEATSQRMLATGIRASGLVTQYLAERRGAHRLESSAPARP
jgi:hypothetical protein